MTKPIELSKNKSLIDKDIEKLKSIGKALFKVYIKLKLIMIYKNKQIFNPNQANSLYV